MFQHSTQLQTLSSY